MIINQTDIEILNKLVGPISEKMATIMYRNIDSYLHPRVSLFMPSRGQCEYAVTPNHAHPAYAFIYYFQPVNDFVVEGKHISYDMSEGKCLSAMSPYIQHQEIVEDNFQSYIAITIEAELFHDIMKQYSETIPIFRGEIFVPHPELLGLLRCFILEASGYTKKNIQLLECFAFTIVHLVVRSVLYNTPCTIPLYDRFEVDHAIAFMNSNYSKRITIENLAGTVNLSPGHFSKLFKSITGETPIDFLNMLRLQKAKIMLMNQADSITEIAIQCGFNTSSYFSACFQAKYKMSPSSYRQNFLIK